LVFCSDVAWQQQHGRFAWLTVAESPEGSDPSGEEGQQAPAPQHLPIEKGVLRLIGWAYSVGHWQRKCGSPASSVTNAVIQTWATRNILRQVAMMIP
jgi:hypothetical protein